ncbi:DNA repair protein RecN [Thermoproteota archaeon]
MLKTLRVQNIAIIDTCELDFNPGLTILTGETGAGKSILIESLSILMGKTVQEDVIRAGENIAIIEGVFTGLSLAEDTIFPPYLDGQNELIIMRKICRGKPSTARINNQTVTLKTLRSLALKLCHIMGQHAHLELLDSDEQFRLLDYYGKDRLASVKASYIEQYSQLKDIQVKLEKIKTRNQDLDQRLAYLDFQIQDIEQCQFKEDEEAELNQQKKTLKELGKIKDILSGSADAVDQMTVLCKGITNQADRINETDSFFTGLSAYFSQRQIELTDTLNELHKRLDMVQAMDPEDINRIEARLDQIFRYKTKYKTPSLKDLLVKLNALKEEYNELSNITLNTVTLEKEFHNRLPKVKQSAEHLHKIRKETAVKLQDEISSKMINLNFQTIDFQILITLDLKNLNQDGADSVDFHISTNPGVPARPLRNVASGGELSRIMLAVKSVFFNYDLDKILIFDEVDAGVGGVTAVKIGEYLKLIAKNNQVFCVTHLAQIAKFADAHYIVSKTSTNTRTTTCVTLLDAEQQTREFHRMLGGDAVNDLLKTTVSQTREISLI